MLCRTFHMWRGVRGSGMDQAPRWLARFSPVSLSTTPQKHDIHTLYAPKPPFFPGKRYTHVMNTRIRYNFHIGKNTLKSLKIMAKKDETTVSELIRHAIRHTYGPSTHAGRPQPPR